MSDEEVRKAEKELERALGGEGVKGSDIGKKPGRHWKKTMGRNPFARRRSEKKLEKIGLAFRNPDVIRAAQQLIRLLDRAGQDPGNPTQRAARRIVDHDLPAGTEAADRRRQGRESMQRDRDERERDRNDRRESHEDQRGERHDGRHSEGGEHHGGHGEGRPRRGLSTKPSGRGKRTFPKRTKPRS